jgi:hypothetical protein
VTRGRVASRVRDVRFATAVEELEVPVIQVPVTVSHVTVSHVSMLEAKSLAVIPDAIGTIEVVEEIVSSQVVTSAVTKHELVATRLAKFLEKLASAT